jgi:hypothetical protein
MKPNGHARRAPTGPLPEAIIGGRAQASVEPSEEWMKVNLPIIEAAKAKGEDPGLTFEDKDREVLVQVNVLYTIPSALLPREQWTSVQVPAGEVRIPMVQLRELVAGALDADHPGLAARVRGGPSKDAS